MAKMFVLICVVWIEGSRYDGGEQRCIMHKSKVHYANVNQCRADIPKSTILIENAIFEYDQKTRKNKTKKMAA